MDLSISTWKNLVLIVAIETEKKREFAIYCSLTLADASEEFRKSLPLAAAEDADNQGRTQLQPT